MRFEGQCPLLKKCAPPVCRHPCVNAVFGIYLHYILGLPKTLKIFLPPLKIFCPPDKSWNDVPERLVIIIWSKWIRKTLSHLICWKFSHLTSWNFGGMTDMPSPLSKLLGDASPPSPPHIRCHCPHPQHLVTPLVELILDLKTESLTFI